MTHCQGETQVQQASQTSVTIQTVGTAAQQPTELAGQSASSQLSSTITQIQIGCVSQCFGLTSTGTATATLAEQVLAELSSLAPPDGSPSLDPAPGSAQNVVAQTSCQLQTGQATTGTQLQSASQSSATVQLIGLAPSLPAFLISPSGGSESSGNSAVDQTQQQIWQLQIGCLFYCVDTQQVQQAQQTVITIQLLAAPSGASGTDPSATSTTGTDTAAQQLIWQLQIGCLAWCYDATPLQDATSQTTVTVITLSPPASNTPTPPAAQAPGGTTDPAQPPTMGRAGVTPVVASASPAVTSAPPEAPSGNPATGIPSPTAPVSRSLAEAGRAIADRRPSAIAVIAPALPAAASTVSRPATDTASRRTTATHGSIASHSSSPRSHRRRQVVSRSTRRLSVPLAASAVQAHRTVSIALVALALAAAAALLALEARNRLHPDRPER